MDGKALRQALHSGKRIYGTMLVGHSPSFCRTLVGLGLDFVFIDTEHIATDRETVAWMCAAYQALNLAPLVRIPTHDIYDASMMLDAGAAGIIVPYTEDIETVREMVGAVKYKPLKGDRLKRILTGAEQAEPALLSYLEEKNAARSLIINIESVPAMEKLDQLLTVPGLDGVLIGPHDLSCSLGIPEQYRSEIYKDAVSAIIRRARSLGLGAGIHVHYSDGLSDEVSWCNDAGANLIVHYSDILAFAVQMKSDLSELKKQNGDSLNLSDIHINI